jgi:hypothetical protein
MDVPAIPFCLLTMAMQIAMCAIAMAVTNPFLYAKWRSRMAWCAGTCLSIGVLMLDVPNWLQLLTFVGCIFFGVLCTIPLYKK